jgi:general secretion pathway protein H
MDARVAQAMPQISRTWSIDRKGGFTLIEMVAVMLIIALVAGLAVSFMAGTGRAQLEALALKTAALFRRERQGAILTGQSRLVSLDFNARSLIGDSGDEVAIPRDVVVDVLGADAQWEGRRAVVRFEPDGASTGTVLRLSREGVGYEVRVNWFTGGVAVEQHQR